MNKITFLLVASSVLYFAACRKEEYAPTYNDWPVIEGYLFANNFASVKVSRQVSSTDNIEASTDNIDSLNLTISSDSEVYQMIPVGDGMYENKALIIQEGKQYELKFIYNKKEVTAITTVLSLPQNFTQSEDEISVTKIDSTFTFSPGNFPVQNDPIKLKWDNPDNSYYMVVTQNIEENPVLIRDTTNERFAVRVFRNEPSVTDQLEIRDMQFTYFGTHLLLLYHLNPDYATLYNDNSNSSQNLTNPSTNITNGYGIFTGISVDTLRLKVTEAN